MTSQAGAICPPTFVRGKERSLNRKQQQQNNNFQCLTQNMEIQSRKYFILILRSEEEEEGVRSYYIGPLYLILRF